MKTENLTIELLYLFKGNIKLQSDHVIYTHRKVSREIVRVKQVGEEQKEGESLYYCNKMKFQNSVEMERWKSVKIFNLLRDAAIISSLETWRCRISLMFKRDTTQEDTTDKVSYLRKNYCKTCCPPSSFMGPLLKFSCPSMMIHFTSAYPYRYKQSAILCRLLNSYFQHQRL